MKFRIIECPTDRKKFCIEKKHWLMGWQLIKHPLPMTMKNMHLYAGPGPHSLKWKPDVYDTLEEAESVILKWRTKELIKKTKNVEVIKEIEI